MARKKRKGGDKPPRRRRPVPETPPPLPDRRLLEQSLRDLVGGPEGPVREAQELLDQAYEAPRPARRIELAREALAAWPDAADAYVLLAEHTPNRRERLALYEQGVAAGERALGARFFRDEVGRFWGFLETRPYMRARLALACELWPAGRRDEAIAHLWDMLRLNPNDNQGVRYTLAGFLAAEERNDELAGLLGRYDEGSTFWRYTHALLAFRQGGDTPESRKMLQDAIKANAHVPDYLLARKKPPEEPAPFYGIGDDNEATMYVQHSLAAWKDTAGAVAWLRANDPHTLKQKAQTPTPKGPLKLVKNWLKKKLPQTDAVWQADARPLANPMLVGGDRVRAWVVAILSRDDDLALDSEVLMEEPSQAALWDALVQAMQNPKVGEPQRPAEIEVRPGPWEGLRPHLEEIDVRLTTAEVLDPLEGFFAGISEHLCGPPRPGLLDVPGVGPEQVGRFYAAAAHFFRAAPWKKLGFEAAVRIECDKYKGGPWHAVVMGQSGMTTGLALYEGLGPLRRLLAGVDDPEESARKSVSTAVIFDEEVDLTLADVEAIRRYGWEVARPDAYPLVMHKERGHSYRLPLAWELDLTAGCLRALPDFVARRRQDDPTPEEMTVPAASGDLKLVLSWLPEPTA